MTKSLSESLIMEDRESLIDPEDVQDDVNQADIPSGGLVNINTVMSSMSLACSMNPRKFSYKFGENQIDMAGDVIESSWEYFRPTVEVRENGKLLFMEDSMCVSNYHFETYTKGEFTSLDDVSAYLKEKYQGQTGVEADEPAERVAGDYSPVFYNKEYQAEYDAQVAGRLQEYKESQLDRVVYKDLGVETTSRGTYHKVDFAYACDNKVVGEDKAMPNPYLMTSKKKDDDGKLQTVHSFYLSDSIYNSLVSTANMDGLENSQWSGVIAAKVGYPATRNQKPKLSVNLTRQAFQAGNVMTPAKPFDEKAHNTFVKASMAEVHKKREAMAAAKMPDVQASSPETQMGE